MTYVGMVPTVAVDLARHALAVGADLSSLLPWCSAVPPRAWT